ncbi:MFS transporter [Nonomuraea sp. B12E4]|uniref:MFS transporter n=1 Tax=Nonomuraea sp. B12E4 TaxID=3153564 RepID=UPI00325DC06E
MLTLPVVLVGVVLVAMSISGTAVALPGMGRDLDASGSALNWVVAGYNLAFAAMTLVAGSTADRVGRRRVFIVAALVFAAGFLATALSQAIVITDGQAMALVPAEVVGMAAGFLNTLRGAAEALVIAAFCASLIGLLAARLGDAGSAAAVSAGRITSGAGAAAELDAFTWSWQMTQLGVALLCLVLSVVAGALILRRATRPRHTV